MQPVQDQGKIVVDTVKNFQGLAIGAQDEAQKLVNGLEGVVTQLTKAQALFATAFGDIKNSVTIPGCEDIRVSP